MHHSLSINKLRVLRAEMRHKIFRITISLFLDRELEVERHRPLQEAEQILLHMHGSKWLRRNHHQDRKLILSKVQFPDHLEAMRTLLCCL